MSLASVLWLHKAKQRVTEINQENPEHFPENRLLNVKFGKSFGEKKNVFSLNYTELFTKVWGQKDHSHVVNMQRQVSAAVSNY